MKKFDLDEILISLGGWGKFQSLYYLVLCSAIIFSVFPAMNYIFVARDIKYRLVLFAYFAKQNAQDASYLDAR
jgi:TM2 domain-containing membrane protein YozV